MACAPCAFLEMQNNSQGGHFVQARGPGADSEEKREPVSDIDTVVADSLKVLDLKRPIREADVSAEGSPCFYALASLARS
jgi:hypothetical protein